MHKYRNKPCEINGEKYRSQLEHKVHADLLMLEKCGEIFNLKREVSFVLAPSVVLNGRKKPDLRYVADFVFYDKHGNKIVKDAKGTVTPLFRVKQHLMKSVHGIEVMVVK